MCMGEKETDDDETTITNPPYGYPSESSSAPIDLTAARIRVYKYPLCPLVLAVRCSRHWIRREDCTCGGENWTKDPPPRNWTGPRRSSGTVWGASNGIWRTWRTRLISFAKFNSPSSVNRETIQSLAYFDRNWRPRVVEMQRYECKIIDIAHSLAQPPGYLLCTGWRGKWKVDLLSELL